MGPSALELQAEESFGMRIECHVPDYTVMIR
jgi:hypothetical protein